MKHRKNARAEAPESELSRHAGADQRHPVALGGGTARPARGDIDERHAAEAPEAPPQRALVKRPLAHPPRQAAAHVAPAEREVEDEGERDGGEPGPQPELPEDERAERDCAVDPDIAVGFDPD